MPKTSLSSDSESAELRLESGRYHHGDLKASLIQGALHLLATEGAEALSLRAIAQVVGVSHTAPYSHFKNKRELIAAVTDAGYERLAQALEAGQDAADQGADRLLDYGAAYLRFALENPELYRLMLGQVELGGRKSTRPAMSLDFSEQGIPPKRPFQLLQRAVASVLGEGQRAQRQALGAWSLVHGLSALLIEGHLTIPPGTDLRAFLVSVAPGYQAG